MLTKEICTIIVILLIEPIQLAKIIQFQGQSTQCQRLAQKQENYKIQEYTVFDKTKQQIMSGYEQQYYYTYNSNENVDQIMILHSMFIQYLLVQLCPIDFVAGYEMRGVFSIQYPKTKGKNYKIVKNVSFLPENNKCFYYQIPAKNQLIKFEGILKLGLKALCSNNVQNFTPNTIKLSLSYNVFDVIQWKQSTQEAIILMLLGLSGTRLIYSILKQVVSYYQNPLSGKQQQANCNITHFDLIMPAEISLIQCFNDERECLICLQAIQNTEIRITPCNHSFHKDCIDNWGKRKLSCPTCRQSLKQQLI